MGEDVSNVCSGFLTPAVVTASFGGSGEFAGLIVCDSESEALVKQLLLGLDEESKWITGCEDSLLRMGAISLDDRSNRQLLDSHQDLLEELTKRQTAIRSIVFQAEQFLRSTVSVSSPATRKQLQLKVNGVRERSEHAHNEAESRIRTLIGSFDALEHLTYKLHDLQNTLKQFESVLTISSTGATMDTSQFNFGTAVQRLNAAVSEANTAQAEISNLPCLVRNFLGHVSRYTRSKNAYRESLDCLVAVEDDKPLEHTVRDAVREASDRLFNLGDRVRDRLACMLSAQEKYEQFIDEVSRHTIALDTVGKKFRSIDFGRIAITGSRLSSTQRGQVQAHSNTLVELIGLLENTGHDLQVLLKDTFPKLQISLMDAGFTQAAVDQVVKKPLVGELKRYESLISGVKQKSTELVRLLSEGQSVSDTLSSTVQCLEKVEHRLAHPVSGKTQEESTELHEAQAELSSQNVALDVARSRVQSVLKKAAGGVEAVSEADIRTAREFEKQIDILDQRLAKNQTEVECRLRDITATQETMNRCEREAKDILSWTDKTFASMDSPPFFRAPESHLRKRLQAVQSQLGLRKKQTQELGEQVRALPASFLGAKKLKENISVLEARLEQLDHRLTLAMRNLDLLDARCAPYCAARQAAEEWLITTCGVVQGLSAIALASEELSRQSAETKELLDRWKAQGDQLNEVYRLGTAYDALSHSVKHGSRGSEDSTAFEQESSDVKREMKDLRERYSTLGTQIQERQNTLEAVSKEVSALEQHRDDLVTWLGKRVQALVGQTRKLTDLQTINDASIEAQRIHDELVSGMSGLDELRKRAATLLQNRSYVAGAAELRNAVTETEHHWSTAVNAATERQRSLERLIRDVAEFKRLDGTLSQRLRQITLAARASPLIDQTTLELAPSHLKQIRSIQSELDSLTPDIVQMRELGKRLTDRLQPPVVAELQIGQQIHHVSSVHDQAQKDLALKANQYEKVLGPSFQFEQLLDDVDGILGGAQRQIDTPGISRKDRHEVEDQMNKARTLLTRARALGKQLSDSTTDAAMKFGIETKLLQMENLFNQTSRALAGPPGQDRLDGRIPLPAQTQFGALCNWMSEKSNQLEKANELLGQQFSGLGELSLDQVAQQIKVLHDTQEEIQQKRQGLQTAVSALPPEMLGTANQQLDLLSKAIAAKQTQLEKVASEPTSLTASLNQLEAWINSEIGDLTKPLATHGAFLADPTQMVATEQKLKSKSIEVRRKMEDLNSLKQKLKLPLKDIPGSMVNGLLHQADSILLSLTRLDSEVQNRIDQIADVKRCHTQAQQAVAAYRRAVDDAETKWIDLQQARLEKRPIRVDHTGEESISTPGSPRSLPMDQMANLQAELFALLEETATTGALQTRPSPTLTMIQAMQQLEHSLKAAGDNDPRRSVTEIMNDIRATRKRIEAIIQSVNNDLGSAEASASANTTVNLIKQVNAVARQVRSAAERLSNFPEKSPGVVPKTLRERTQSVNEIKDELSHCKEVIGELQAQLQSQARAPGAPGCVAELLGQLESLDKETGSLENRAEQLESEVRNRLPKAQQMAELRQQLATSVNQARKACLPASGAALDASTGLMSAENLIKKLRDDLARMRTVSRQLSENYADEITQRQMESEIVTAEAVIAQLSEQLVAQAVGQRDQTGSLLIQVRNNLQRLQHQYDELRNDFAAQALRSATSGDCSNLRDNCRLMLTRAESCTDELNHMKTVIASLHGVQTHENMDELHKRIDQLLGNYAVFIGELKEQLKESVKAEATQKQLMDRLQEADSWLTEQRHRFNQPVYGAPEDTETGDSKMVADVRSSLKLTRSLAKEVDSKRDVFRKLKSDGDILISSKQVLDPEPIRDRLGALQDAYGDLRSGIQQRLSAFEAALPTTQRLVSALTTLGLRLPAAESRLRSLCASTSDPINLRRSGVDALEAELSNILAPQAHLVRTNWNRLQELSVPPSVFSRTLTLPDGTKSEVKHAEQIEAELHRFDKFQMQLSELATEVSSTRYKTNVLLNKLDEESRWLNSALQRLDPLASDDPAHWTGDAEEGEKNFVKLDGNALASFTDQSALLNEFPSLAVLPANYGPLSQVRDRLYHFRENWEERQKSRTQILLTEAHGLLQAAGIRVSGIADSGRTLGRHFGDKLGRQLVLAVDLLSKRMAQLDTRLGQVEVRVGEALPLSRSFYADMGEFADTMNADEAELERLSLPGKLEPRKKTELGELDNERALHKQIKTLDEKTESHKTLLDQITRTSVPLIDLVAKTNGITIRDSVRNATDRYRQLRKAVKARLTSVETRLKQSDEIAEQLDVMSDLFADVAQQASHLGIPVDPSTIWARPAATPGVELVDSPVPLTQQSGLLAEAGVGRVRPMVSVQPDQLQEHLNETRELIETLSQRLPELEALTACVRAQLEPKLAAIKTQRKAQLDSSEVVDPFAADAERAIELHKTLLRTAEKLQTDWLGLQKQLEARVAKLSAIHETSSVGFWSRVNELQAALIQAGGTLRIIATGCDPADASTRRDPLDPTSYVQQRNDLGALLQQVDHLTSQLSACQHAGAQLIQLITGASSPEDTLQLRREEEQAIRNEVNSALNELDALHKDLLTSCQRLSNHIDKQETAAKQFKMGLEDFIRWLSQQEVIWDQFAPIANETVSVLKQLEEIIAWNDGLLYKHSDLEALNWSASQLSAVDLDELGTLSMEDTVGPTSTVPSSLQSDLAGANRRWDTLLDSSNHRRHRLQTVLLGLGEFDQALDALIKWISMAQANVDQIPVRRGNIRGLEADLARVKIIQNNVNNHQLAVVRVHEQAKRRIDSSRRDIPEVPSNIDAQKPSAEPSMSQTAERLNTMNEMWEHLKASTKEKQCILEEALRETFNFHGQFDNLVRRCRQLESRIPTPGTRIMGCLPDSAREQLRRFMDIYNGLVEVGDKLTDLRKVSAALLVSASSSADQPPERLTSALDRFRDHHSQLLRRATAIRDQLQSGLSEVERFHAELAQMMQWLTSMERTVAQQMPVSRIVARLGQLILDHAELRRSIASHRDVLLSLDRMGAQVQHNAQKQDVVLVKNLLSSVHNRWEQLLSRTAERTRQLNVGLKEAQTFLNNWTTLTEWLKEQLTCLEEQCESVATRSERIAHQLTQHYEFQRALGARNVTFDSVRRYARYLRDRAPVCDHQELDDMVNELKHLWNAVCSRSLDRQRMLEQALLSAGLYKEALQSLTEWLSGVEPQLSEHQVGYCGDVDTVEHLIEAHRRLVSEVDERAGWIQSIHEAADELMRKASKGTIGQADVAAIKGQLNHLDGIWDRVQLLTKKRGERLDEALKLAVQFQEMCRSLMDYFAGAEHVIRRLAALPTYDDLEDEPSTGTLKPKSAEAPESLAAAINAHDQTHKNLLDQSERVQATLHLGNQLMAQAHPEAVQRLRQWIHAIQSRWSDLIASSTQRADRLRAALDDQKRRQLLRTELLDWIKATQDHLDREPTITFASTTKRAVDTHDADKDESQDNDQISTLGSDQVFLGASDVDDSSSVATYRTLPLNEITEPELIERLLAEHAELEREAALRQPVLDLILKHAKRRTIQRTSTLRGSSLQRGRASGRTTSRPATGKVKVGELQTTEPNFVSSSANQLYQRWSMLQRALAARRTKLRDRLTYLSEVEKMRTFQFESWRQRYVAWLNENKSRVIDLFHRKDLDHDGRLTYAEFIDGILEMKFQTTRVELQTVAEIFDANGDGYIDYRECLNALRAGYVASRMTGYNTSSSQLSLSQIGPSDEEAINCEVRRQIGLCTCHNTYQICKMATDKYRFGDSQKLRLVRILRSAVMVRVGGGWTTLDEFLAKNDPCRASAWKSVIDVCEGSITGDRTTGLCPKPSSRSSTPKYAASTSIHGTAHSFRQNCTNTVPSKLPVKTSQQRRASTASLPHSDRGNSQLFDHFDSKSLSGVVHSQIILPMTGQELEDSISRPSSSMSQESSSKLSTGLRKPESVEPQSDEKLSNRVSTPSLRDHAHLSPSRSRPQSIGEKISSPTVTSSPTHSHSSSARSVNSPSLLPVSRISEENTPVSSPKTPVPKLSPEKTQPKAP
ncbi:Microtubule-actin cross-linking factor 1, isoforms 1/2/3/5 [Clonorchis sinensis]|uniref:Microtubule-actin cross-linking factor 1, isoforms 1/2/3/5 n=1 Tax=Clonorchis sinensis TaxID=79923 RepID=A0A419Q7C4_CLOSI|nr:Microtubule-actin cross-linking factor 1, isoforms 1/2/3/5 [Clonorchis sinensis]